jgi:hypothetical protein
MARETSKAGATGLVEVVEVTPIDVTVEVTEVEVVEDETGDMTATVVEVTEEAVATGAVVELDPAEAEAGTPETADEAVDSTGAGITAPLAEVGGAEPAHPPSAPVPSSSAETESRPTRTRGRRGALGKRGIRRGVTASRF